MATHARRSPIPPPPQPFTAADKLVLAWLREFTRRGWPATVGMLAQRAKVSEETVTVSLRRWHRLITPNATAGTYQFSQPAEVKRYHLAPAGLFAVWQEYGDPTSTEDAALIRRFMETEVQKMGPTILENPAVVAKRLKRALERGDFQLTRDGYVKIRGRLDDLLKPQGDEVTA